jgi:hypothetical protein
LYVAGHPYNDPPPEIPTRDITIQFIEFTYYNDRFATDTLDRETMKYQPLIDNITTKGWNVAPLIVLAAGARDTTHIPSMKKLETTLKLPITKIKDTFKQINIIATHYAHFALVHKRRPENRQTIDDLHNPP